MSKWFGTVPANCDICKERIDDTFIDGATRFGCWANMCPECHTEYGRGTGTGRGQTYHRNVDGTWTKVSG